jgi:hypothetical protein
VQGGRCPRCRYIKPVEGKVVFTAGGGGAPAIPPTSAALGIAKGFDPATLTIPALTFATGEALICGIASDLGGSPPTAKWNGISLVDRSAYGGSFSSNTGLLLFSLANMTAGTGSLVVTWSIPPLAGAVCARRLSQVPANPHDPTLGSDAEGSQNSGTALTCSPYGPGVDNFFPLMFFATLGPVGDTAGTWNNGFTAGQRDGTTGGATLNMTIADATGPWVAVHDGGTHTVTYSGYTSREACVQGIIVRGV